MDPLTDEERMRMIVWLRHEVDEVHGLVTQLDRLGPAFTALSQQKRQYAEACVQVADHLTGHGGVRPPKGM